MANEKDSASLSISNSQFSIEIKALIDAAKQRAAIAVNAEISLLYWQVGQRIQQENFKG